MVTEAERRIVLAEGVRRGWPAEELDAAIAIESGWNPAAHHPVTRAGGLIGFMPFIMAKLGWTAGPEAFWRLSAAEQAPFVGRYFDLVGVHWTQPGDTYVALAAPKYVGAPDGTEVYPRGSKAWQLNPGWRDPLTGLITAGSIRRVLLRKMRRGPAKLPANARVQWSPLGVLVLVAAGAWLAWRMLETAEKNRTPAASSR
jgi:hypothetical protein